MNKEGSSELTKSWVVVDQNPDEITQKTKDTSGVQEVTENEPHDSDTDSISVISESGCSYKTDEEEFFPMDLPVAKDKEKVNEESETPKKEPETVSVQSEAAAKLIATTLNENKAIETMMYFATSAVCAIILVGFSIAVQNYIQRASNNNLESDQHVFPHVQILKTENMLKESYSNKFHLKRKNQFKLEEFEPKIAKLKNDNELHDKIRSSVGDNDPKVEGNFKSNYKLSKNKNIAVECNKENSDVSEKHVTNQGDEINRSEELDQKTNEQTSDGETYEGYDKKAEKLRIKEDYLKEKEKFLIEKEHDLLKKEIKLNKDKQQYTKNKPDKNTFNKKERKHSEESSDFSERKDKFKYKKRPNEKNNKKKFKEDKKQDTQKRFRFSAEQGKKRNVSGHWYLNLHEGRDNMRQKKRANFKRNKAHWYFQWMVDRARLRVK